MQPVPLPIARIPDGERIASSLASAARMLAGRIAEGGTLWCAAPGMADHARHLAVEFVHPASVGAKSVPAVALVTAPGDPLVDAVRSSARPGDVLVTMGDGDSAVVDELRLRTQAWGVAHLHLGWSDATRPNAGAGWEVTVGVDPRAERFLTRTYHLLWELTFLCLRHVRSGSEPSPCAVCADEATIAEVESALDSQRVSARTACGPVILDVSLIEPTRRHDLLIVHAGTALRLLRSWPVEP